MKRDNVSYLRSFKKYLAKSQVSIIALMFCSSLKLDAQFVTIPDTFFVNWLTFHYPDCMNGSQMDTTCPGIVNAKTVDLWNIDVVDLAGVQYFSNLDTFIYKSLNIGFYATNFSGLPHKLHYLVLEQNSLTSLATLPDSLQYFDCAGGQLTSLPDLPNSLLFLKCGGNHLTGLPLLPDSLQFLDCSINPINILPSLPASLSELHCNQDSFTTLPSLPNGLKILSCSYNVMNQLPALPTSLTTLYCSSNLLTSLPPLSNALITLDCHANHLTQLPTLPNSLKTVACNHNDLSNLPEFPDTLIFFDCSNNINLTCLPQIKTIIGYSEWVDEGCGWTCYYYGLNFSNTAITCIPDTGNVRYSTPKLDTVPLCSAFNVNGCQAFTSVKELPSIFFTIYPNPTSDYCLVQVANVSEIYNIHITDVNGNLLLSRKITEGLTKLETVDFSDGLYFVKVSDSKGLSQVTKLVVAK